MNEDYNFDDLLEPEKIQLPDARSLSDKPENEVIEIRNHLLVTYYLNNKLLNLEREVSIDEIKRVHCILLKDTPQEKISVWGNIQEAGKFRTVSMQAPETDQKDYVVDSMVEARAEKDYSLLFDIVGTNHL
ncbi:9542_t:CDS:2 [Ambispora gerdemannii]|uniref:9542_t:CDS:1 n=1 Tax=Ambispora gerdemannii TaxID=144530 RepID=A0A9N8V850_9GLOM|nr:9542_t:CDS:2 [Ambispora gerdemannii]